MLYNLETIFFAYQLPRRVIMKKPLFYNTILYTIIIIITISVYVNRSGPRFVLLVMRARIRRGHQLPTRFLKNARQRNRNTIIWN